MNATITSFPESPNQSCDCSFFRSRRRWPLVGGLFWVCLLFTASAQAFTNLHSFTGGSDGASPFAGLVLSGNTLYGTAYGGGASGIGTVFAVNSNGTGFTNLHSFTATSGPLSANSDGANPFAGLVLSGNTLYGTAYGGGTSGFGTVFAVNTDGTGFTNLHSFTATSGPLSANGDGANPFAGLVLSGNTLYGTAYGGGTSGFGTVFAVSTDGTGFTNLHSFTATSGPLSANGDGANPLAGLVLSGNILYGTAYGGGNSGFGTVFALNTDGTGFTNLHSFTETAGPLSTNADGTYPQAGLVLSGTTLYGTAYGGGSAGVGTVFAVNTDGTGFTNLRSFVVSPGEAANPVAGLVLSGTTLYGTAYQGGGSGVGTVFAVSTYGTGFTNLHSFAGSPSDGAYPYAGLILAGNTLYGTTGGGGSSDNGMVFSLPLPASGPPNQPPIVINPIPDQTAIDGIAFSFTFAANTFGDPDAGQILSYTASNLPPGITFAGFSRTFSGTPTNAGTFSVTVTATDNGTPPLSTNETFYIAVASTAAYNRWVGDGGANQWNFAAANWTHGLYHDGDDTLFDDGGSTNPPVDITTLVAPASVLVNAAKTYTFSGAGGISGAAALTKASTGELKLATSNSYSGVTTVSGGRLTVQHSNALGTAAGGTMVALNGSLQIDGHGLNIAEPLSLFVPPIDYGAGPTNSALNNVANSNTWSGPISLGTHSVIRSSSGLLTLNSANPIAGPGTLYVAGDGDMLISSGIGSDVASILKYGTGTLTLTGTNASAGGIGGSGGSGRVVASPSALGSGGISCHILEINAGGAASISNPISLSQGTLRVSGGTVIYSHAGYPMIDFTAAFETATTSDQLIINSPLVFGLSVGGFSSYLDVVGPGTTTINSGIASVFDAPFGYCTFSGGILQLNHLNALGHPGSVNAINLSGGALQTGVDAGGAFSTYWVNVAGDATIQPGRSTSGAGVSNYFGDLFFSAGQLSVSPGVNLTSGSTADLGFGNTGLQGGDALFHVQNSGGVNARLTLTGSVDDNSAASPRSLTKSGSGTLVLMAAGSYRGGTIVSNGTLRISNPSGSATGTNSVTVLDGATLTGNGGIAGPVTIQSGGTLAAGNSIGRMAISNNLTFAAGATNVVEVSLSAGTNDLVVGLANVACGGTLVVSNVGLQAFTNGAAFKLFDAASYGGSFAGIQPPTPGVGLQWDAGSLTVDGTLRVTLGVTCASNLTVTNTADSGPGSLRQAILNANDIACASNVFISFNIPGAGVQTIAPVTPLPAITRPVRIDGCTQPGASPNTLANADNAVLLVELNGSNLNLCCGFNIGLWIKANDCTVRGLVINRFASEGILVQGFDGSVLEGNFVGTDATGTNALGNFIGIGVSGYANRVGGVTPAARNIVSGNVYGIEPDGVSNQVLGNFVGVGADGTTVVSNVNGIYVSSSYETQIGGATPGAGNVISGNVNGCSFNGGGSNVIQGNCIGTDVSGTLARGNLSGLVLNESANNVIGGTDAGAGNLVSGNLSQGVVVEGVGATNNVVAGNLIGTDITGTNALGNTTGISLYGSAGNQVGGLTPAARNIISGNLDGLDLYSAVRTEILGNYIGLGGDGLTVVSNFYGISMNNCSLTQIGGSPPGARNVISGNRIGCQLSAGNFIQGNFIGTDASGRLPRGNLVGVTMPETANDNLIGGPNAGEGNLISGNGSGVLVQALNASNNVVAGNLIGTDVTGTNALGNLDWGVLIYGPAGNVIGGTSAGARNVISGNAGVAVGILGATASNNVVAGNFIGTDPTGTTALGNRDSGVYLVDASGNVIGGTTPGAGNVIAYSTGAGVVVHYDGATNNAVLGNSIFANGGLGIDLGGDGVTPNDSGDADGSPNHFQNFPEILAAVLSNGTLHVSYRVDSAALNSTYPLTVEFFIADRGGDGRTLIQRAIYSTPQAMSNLAFIPLAAVNLANRLVATATDANGNTSEFSPPEAITGLGEPVPLVITAADGLLTVTWTNSAFGFVLEATENLTPPVTWQVISNGITESGGWKSYTLTNDPGVPSRFYRLRSP